MKGDTEKIATPVPLFWVRVVIVTFMAALLVGVGGLVWLVVDISLHEGERQQQVKRDYIANHQCVLDHIVAPSKYLDGNGKVVTNAGVQYYRCDADVTVWIETTAEVTNGN